LHFGRTRSQYSAFLLDFGDVLAIEFNELGACYIYQRHKSKLFPDIYRGAPFSDHELKQRPLAEEWVAHHGNWEWKLARILSRFGIRQ